MALSSSYWLARGGQRLFALQAQRQCGLQPGLRGGVVETGQFLVDLRSSLRIGGDLLLRRFDGALQFALARDQRARLEGGLLGLAFQRAQLLARGVEPALGIDDRIVQLAVTLLRIGQLLVKFLEACLAQAAALAQLVQLRAQLGQLAVELAAPRLAGLGLLRQAQQLHLRLVSAGLRFGGLAPGAGQAQRGFGVGGFDAHTGAARFVGDQALCAELALQVLDLLLPRQHAGLLGIGRVEAHRVLRHRMAFARHDHFAMRQLTARGQRLVQAGRGVHAFEPVVEQRLQPGIVQPQQLRQARQRAVRAGDGAGIR